MFSKLKIYLCIVFVLFAQTAQADKIKPLNDWARETQRWQNDATEVAYALTRCGILFSTIGIYFVANGTKAEDKANGEKFIDKGKFLNMTGIEMAVSNGMGIDAATARNKKVAEQEASRLALEQLEPSLNDNFNTKKVQNSSTNNESYKTKS